MRVDALARRTQKKARIVRSQIKHEAIVVGPRIDQAEQNLQLRACAGGIRSLPQQRPRFVIAKCRQGLVRLFQREYASQPTKEERTLRGLLGQHGLGYGHGWLLV